MTLSFALVTLMHASADTLQPGDHIRSLPAGQRTRTYLIHIPPRRDPKKPTPAVLAFHGGGSNATQMVRFCGLNETAEKHGFIVVYPNGTGRLKTALTWNAGNCCGYAMQHEVDDVAFTRALLDDLGKLVTMDARRVYATGMSNGAIMAYRLASELSDRIAAIAPVAGPMGAEKCSPKRPVSVIHFHGTDDQFAPFQGGKGARSLSQIRFFSVEHSIRAWVKANGCKDEPETIRRPDTAGDGTTATIKTYTGGKEGSEVKLVIIENMGHTWPGREPPLKILGKSTRNVSANAMMWEFFQRHPLR
jgi:polyhydroxybutyrate depolymerase